MQRMSIHRAKGVSQVKIEHLYIIVGKMGRPLDAVLTRY